MLSKIGVFKIFAIFTAKHLVLVPQLFYRTPLATASEKPIAYKFLTSLVNI